MGKKNKTPDKKNTIDQELARDFNRLIKSAAVNSGNVNTVHSTPDFRPHLKLTVRFDKEFEVSFLKMPVARVLATKLIEFVKEWCGGALEFKSFQKLVNYKRNNFSENYSASVYLTFLISLIELLRTELDETCAHGTFSGNIKSDSLLNKLASNLVVFCDCYSDELKKNLQDISSRSGEINPVAQKVKVMSPAPRTKVSPESEISHVGNVVSSKTSALFTLVNRDYPKDNHSNQLPLARAALRARAELKARQQAASLNHQATPGTNNSNNSFNNR